MHINTPSPRLIKKNAVKKKIGDVSDSTLSRIRRNDPKFPKPVKFDSGAQAWFEHEVDFWLIELERG